MTPTQIKVAIYGGAVLLLLLCARNAMAAKLNNDLGRVTKELEIDASINSPTFGLTPDQIVALNSNNPAVDPTMRAYIDASNAAIAADDRDNGHVDAIGP